MKLPWRSRCCRLQYIQLQRLWALRAEWPILLIWIGHTHILTSITHTHTHTHTHTQTLTAFWLGGYTIDCVAETENHERDITGWCIVQKNSFIPLTEPRE